MPIRLLALDLDGTTLTAERLPHADNIPAIKRAVDAGIMVVMASGRPMNSVRDMSGRLGLDGAMICSNGGHVTGPGGQELLFEGLDPTAVDISLEYALEADVHISAYTRNELFFLDDTEWGDVYRRRVRIAQPQVATPIDVRRMEVLKVLYMDDPDRIKHHRRILEARLGELANLTESEPEYLEVLSSKADKAQGLKVLADSLGIRREEVAAIGDYLNDVEMVGWASFGGAVANAVDEVKAVADVIVPSNEEGGVSAFIDLVLAQM